MSTEDQQLESIIAEQALILSYHPDREARKQAFIAMRELVAQRSPERVQEMEQSKGLER